jgi:mannose-6-phosphate isomerase-like protein (cupin superfamily)
MEVVARADCRPFTTEDGSEIRELLAHRNSAIRHQSLAEATLRTGQSTRPHFHPKAEEIYYILKGQGRLRMDGEERVVGPGDAIAIPPGMPHQILHQGREDLVFLCCCAPGYEPEDVVFTE